MTHLISSVGPQLGLVSSTVPLMSNLTVRQNIALICQYKRNISERKTQFFVQQCMQRIELDYLADRQDSALTEKERFLVMLLRAFMVLNSVIVIDRPFKIVHYLQDISCVYEILEKLNDLYSQCVILDYVHEKIKYGVPDAAES